MARRARVVASARSAASATARVSARTMSRVVLGAMPIVDTAIMVDVADEAAMVERLGQVVVMRCYMNWGSRWLLSHRRRGCRIVTRGSTLRGSAFDLMPYFVVFSSQLGVRQFTVHCP
jgi:hypothetical protein